MRASTKGYLGDSVYVDLWEEGLVLTTENGSVPSNTIYLEPEALEALVKWVNDMARLRAIAAAPRSEQS